MPSFDGVFLLFIFIFYFFCCACCKFIFSHHVQLCGSHAHHAPVYTLASLSPRFDVFAASACCLRLNCKTWPFKNAPRLPKLCQCLELCRGQSSQKQKKIKYNNNKIRKLRDKGEKSSSDVVEGGSHGGCGQSYATGALQNLWKLIFLNGKPKRQLNAKRSICEWGHEFYWHFHLQTCEWVNSNMGGRAITEFNKEKIAWNIFKNQQN